jgi:two-component system, cell cycle sensor histidine kinase and response regulator CckA
MLPTNEPTGKPDNPPALDPDSGSAGLRPFAESSHDAIIGQTPEGVIMAWNPAAADLYGYAAAEALGRNIALLYPPETRVEEAEILRRILAGRRVDGYRADRIGKSRGRFTVSVTASPITDLHGEIVGCSRTCRELTARQQAENRMRDLAEAVPDALVGVDRDGRVTMVNDQTLTLFGYRRTELVAMPVETLLPEAARTAQAAHRGQFWSNPRPRPMGTGIRLAARRRNGTQFPVDVSLSTVGTGQDMTAVAFVRDLTNPLHAHAHAGAEQVRAITELLEAQAERDRSPNWLPEVRRLDALGTLAGGVAHEFNNVLAVILSCSDLLGEEIAIPADGSPRRARLADARRDLDVIRSAVDRGAQVTRRLLAFARQALGSPRPVNLNDIVTDAEQLLTAAVGEHVAVITHLAADLWPVTADPDHLRTVLLELTDNARRAMPSIGSLVIDTTNLTLDDQSMPTRAGLRPGRYVRLRVTDTGTGMQPETAARAFEPFFTTKPMGGLGLAAVHGIIAQVGGHTEIYSTPSTGTVVTLLLPAADAAEFQPPN